MKTYACRLLIHLALTGALAGAPALRVLCYSSCVVAAGPTTSIREEPYQADIIKRFGIRAVIGKGGMGERTRQACQEYGCVYLHGIGGAAQVYAQCIEKVLGVSLEVFGSPEAVWQLQVKNFPAVVTIDAHGRSLHQEVSERSQELLGALL